MACRWKGGGLGYCEGGERLLSKRSPTLSWKYWQKEPWRWKPATYSGISQARRKCRPSPPTVAVTLDYLVGLPSSGCMSNFSMIGLFCELQAAIRGGSIIGKNNPGRRNHGLARDRCASTELYEKNYEGKRRLKYVTQLSAHTSEKLCFDNRCVKKLRM